MTHGLLDSYYKIMEMPMIKGDFYPQDITTFARHLRIDPGIVVGRLQHDGYIESSWHNGLRSRYEWKDR